MTLSSVLRSTHKWIAIVVVVPLLFLLVSGIFLQVRKPVDWIQPATERGSETFSPGVTPADVLEAVRQVPEMGVAQWSDIAVTDYRPRKGIIKVRTATEMETQVDAFSGLVIKSQQRWNDIVNHLHDGSAFGGRLSIMLPAALLCTYILLSGVYLLGATGLRKFRNRRRANPVRVRAVPPPFSFTRLCVKSHYWLGLVVVLPWLVVFASGLVLQVRHEIPGVVPEFEHGESTVPTLSYQDVMERARGVEAMKISGWSDIWRVYTYPERGIMEVRTTHGMSMQLDASSGEVLHVGVRAADFWEDLHQGIIGRHNVNGTTSALFGTEKIDLSLLLFLPAHVIALLVLTTGVVYFVRKQLPVRPARRQDLAPAVREAEVLPFPVPAEVMDEPRRAEVVPFPVPAPGVRSKAQSDAIANAARERRNARAGRGGA